MKGLLIKDFKLLLMQKNFFIVFIGISIIMAATTNDISFIIGYLTFIISLFSLSTISYDEFDNGNAFLFTLPFSRMDYVIEKYCFSALLGLCANITSIVLTLAYCLFKGTKPDMEMLFTALAIFAVMLLMQAIMIPIQLKFGSEKGRVAIIAISGVAFIIGIGAFKLLTLLDVNIDELINTIASIRTEIIAVIVIILLAIVLFISFNISNTIMRKKEF